MILLCWKALNNRFNRHIKPSSSMCLKGITRGYRESKDFLWLCTFRRACLILTTVPDGRKAHATGHRVHSAYAHTRARRGVWQKRAKIERDARALTDATLQTRDNRIVYRLYKVIMPPPTRARTRLRRVAPLVASNKINKFPRSPLSNDRSGVTWRLQKALRIQRCAPDFPWNSCPPEIGSWEFTTFTISRVVVFEILEGVRHTGTTHNRLL